MRVQLAEEDRAGVTQLARDRPIRGRHVVGVDLCARRRSDAGGLVQILERNRDAVQWAPTLPRRELVRCAPRIGQRALGRHGDVGVHARIQLRVLRVSL